MIYRLQRKFILSSAAAIFLVILVIMTVILILNVVTMNQTLDQLIDKVLASNMNVSDALKENRPKVNFWLPRMSDWSPYNTGHFIIRFDGEMAVRDTLISMTGDLTEEEAVEFARSAVEEGKRGWVFQYHYKVYPVENGVEVFFIDGSMSLISLLQSMLIIGVVLLACAFVLLLLIVLFSKTFTKPVAESYEKQKQFITDANHELKTPLTLILTNVDIAEAELGTNEWLDDIRSEGHRMTELVNQLVALSRMDEENTPYDVTEMDLGEIVSDTVSEFQPLAAEQGQQIRVDIEPSLRYRGEEALIRRLISVLMDNAVKYCDEGGEIYVSLKRRKFVVLTVENTYRNVDAIELHRLFDRFYRADKARTAGGYGIGLSIARMIVQKHRGVITAYRKDGTNIGFRAVLK